MLTLPSAFSAFRAASGAECHIIVKLYDGTSTWYFSDKDMHLSDGHVYGILDPEGFSGISENIDVFSKEWGIGEAEVELYNLPYKKNASAADVRVADELDDLVDGTMDIYLCAGPNAASLSDCLHRFSGTVLEAPEYDSETVTVRAVDNTLVAPETLPQRYVTAEYTDPPGDTEAEKIPLVYGKFYQRSDEQYSITNGPGLARGIRCTREVLPADYIFADHACNSCDDMYYKIGQAALEVGGITSVTDGGTLQAIQETTNYCLQYFSLNDTVPTDYDDDQYGATNPANLHDGNYATKTTIPDNVHDTGSTDLSGRGCWGINDYDLLRQALLTTSGNYLDPDTPPKIWVRQKYFEFVDITNTSGNYVRYELYYSRDSSTDRKYLLKELAGVIAGADYQQSGWVEYEGPAASDLTYTIDSPLMFSMFVYGLGGDGVTDNEDLARQGEADIGIKVTLIEPPPEAWGAIEGREFGSWIDVGSRTNSFNSGDLIEDPAYVIESILRDELSLVDADIDMDSFDDATNASIDIHFNLHSKNEMTSNDAIKLMAEQSTFAFFWSSVAKARLVALNDTSPTTASRGSHPVHILYSHIEGGQIRVSKTSHIVDYTEYECQYQQEYGKYRNKGTSGSGTRKQKVRWPNLDGTSANHLAAHLSGVGGVWASAHNQIEFTGIGYTCSDIEIGDWVELDDTTIDPHQKCYGASWSGKQFLVVEIGQNYNSTDIRAIELH